MKKQTGNLNQWLLEYLSRIIGIAGQLPKTNSGDHIAEQLMRSGTTAYASHDEAREANSSNESIRKLRISVKQLRETQKWLKLIRRVPLIDPSDHLDEVLQETEQLTQRVGDRIRLRRIL